MKNDQFFSSYSKHGYYITNPLLDYKDIQDFRIDLDREFRQYEGGARIGIEKINNQKLLKKIIKLFSSKEIQQIAEKTEMNLKKEVFMLPTFEIHKNNHVNLKEFIGWHADCGGEMKYEYCKNILYNKKYFFSKIGIYLQKNENYGGGIDVIKLSHKNFSKYASFIRKIKNIPYRLIRAIHKNFNSLYYAFPEKIFMFFLGAKKLNPQISSAVFFDSRIIHRGSPIEKKVIKNVNFVKGKFIARVPENKNKYSLYCHFGTAEALDSYFYDRLKRKNNQSELSIWLEQIKIIKEIDKIFGEKMDKILTPIKNKYL